MFDAIINRIKPPVESTEIIEPEGNKASIDPFKAFLFDARFVPSRGVACLIKIMS